MFPVLYAGRTERALEARLKGLLSEVEGAYSLVGMTPDAFIAVRDPYGFRPLVMARYKDGWLFASESRAFDIFDDVTDIQEVPPGCFLIVQDEEPRIWRFARARIRRYCSFEKIYFSMPDSVVDGETISQRRERLGVLLARCVRETGIEVDVVCPVPDSSTVAAIAVAETLGLPFRFGIVRNKYMGRTFITPDQAARKRGVRMKLNVDRSIVRGKRILLVDDSIVRGTTLQKIVKMLMDAGALEVHVAISSPPVTHPCFWGIDTPERKDLIAARHTPEELPGILGARSVIYLDVQNLLDALEDPEGQRTCVSCFTGCRPVRGHQLDNGGY